MGVDPIPAAARSDIEEAVAEALDLDDLERGVAAMVPEHTAIPLGGNDLDLIVLWVWATRGNRWPRRAGTDDATRHLIDGAIVAAVHAHDVADGKEPRLLAPHQRDCLTRWEASGLA